MLNIRLKEKVIVTMRISNNKDIQDLLDSFNTYSDIKNHIKNSEILKEYSNSIYNIMEQYHISSKSREQFITVIKEVIAAIDAKINGEKIGVTTVIDEDTIKHTKWNSIEVSPYGTFQWRLNELISNDYNGNNIYSYSYKNSEIIFKDLVDHILDEIEIELHIKSKIETYLSLQSKLYHGKEKKHHIIINRDIMR